MKYLFFAFILFFMVGCFEPPDLPNAPSITAASVIDYQTQIDLFSGATVDTITVSIDFEDGDGDLGLLNANDSTNYFIKILRQKGLLAEEVVFPNGENFNGTFTLSDDRLDGAIRGTLNYGVEFLRIGGTVVPNDTLFFEVSIKDRAGNFSNSATTGTIVIKP